MEVDAVPKLINTPQFNKRNIIAESSSAAIAQGFYAFLSDKNIKMEIK